MLLFAQELDMLTRLLLFCFFLIQPMYSANGDDYIVGDVIGKYCRLLTLQCPTA